MNFDLHKAGQLAHLIRMAQEPGWKAWAWHRAKALAKDCPELYADLPALLTQAMREAADALADAPVPANGEHLLAQRAG